MALNKTAHTAILLLGKRKKKLRALGKLDGIATGLLGEIDKKSLKPSRLERHVHS
jgi:hypothetical protein